MKHDFSKVKKPKVVLVVDNPIRDLPGLTLVAFELAQCNVNVYLMPMSLIDLELWPLMPDLVLMNYLRATNEKLIGRILNAGIQVGILDTEIGVLPSWEEFEMVIARSDQTRKSVSFFLSWGEKVKEFLVSKNYYREDQVKITGCPRFDFYADQWKNVAKRRAPYVIPYSRNLVLMNANFAFVNSNKGFDYEMKMMADQFGYSIDFMKGWYEVEYSALKMFAELANTVAERLPAATVVFRPHPFENMKVYEPLLKKLPNLHLVREGTVDSWIMNAKAVIQTNCTTAIESALSGVPTFQPMWVPAFFKMENANAVSVPFETADHLIESLDQNLKGKYHLPKNIEHELEKVIFDWFHCVDGNSYKRVTGEILDALRKNTSRGITPSVAAAELLKPGKYGFLVKKLSPLPYSGPALMLAKGVRNFLFEISAWKKSHKSFDAEQIQRLSDLISEVHPRSARLKRAYVHKAKLTDYALFYPFGQSVCIEPFGPIE